jgi:hypothetical protein
MEDLFGSMLDHQPARETKVVPNNKDKTDSKVTFDPSDSEKNPFESGSASASNVTSRKNTINENEILFTSNSKEQSRLESIALSKGSSIEFTEEQDDELFGGLEEEDKKKKEAYKRAGKSFKDIINKNHKMRLSSVHMLKKQ